jgi:hypothetical protein
MFFSNCWQRNSNMRIHSLSLTSMVNRLKTAVVGRRWEKGTAATA